MFHELNLQFTIVSVFLYDTARVWQLLAEVGVVPHRYRVVRNDVTERRRGI